MDVKFWSADAHTGTVSGEIPVVGRASLGMEIGGGTLSLEVPLAHLTLADGSPDLAACQRLLGMCAPGARTIVAAVGETVLGEWLVMRRSRRFHDSTVTVTGVEWDAYPSQRQIHTPRKMTGDLTGSLARTLLLDLFDSMNNIAVTVPTTSAGRSVSIDERQRSGRYYSDALRDLQDQSPGFEWRVGVTGSWADGTLEAVSRTVKFGVPVLKGGSAMTVVAPEVGSRAGAILGLDVSEDFERTASAVYVRGAGDGAKQIVGAHSDWAEQSRLGWVSRTRVYQYPDVTSQAAADRMARMISDRSQSLWGASDVTLLLDRLPSMPVIGGTLNMIVPPSFVLPEGFTQSMRVGALSLDVTAGRADQVTVAAADEDEV